MSEKYQNMKNADFKLYCESEGIDVDSKNVSKPTRDEYIIAIEKFESSQQAGDNEFLNTEPELGVYNGMQEEKKPETKKVKPLTRAQKRRKQYNTLMVKKRVIITNNSSNQTKQPMEYISWGNRTLGHNTDIIVFDKPWHVREGALRNLRGAVITESIQDEEGNQVRFETKASYIIQELPPLTREEIDLIAKKQLIRDSSIDSLI